MQALNAQMNVSPQAVFWHSQDLICFVWRMLNAQKAVCDNYPKLKLYPRG